MLFVLLQAVLATATPLRARDDGATAFASNSAGNLKLSSIDAPVKGDGTPGDSTWKLSIDDSQSGFRQQITGFGAAVTDATVSSFSGLSSDKLDALIKEMMTSNGADFALMRHTIGASDLSGDPVYTYDDNDNNADTDLKNFGIGDRGGAMADLLAKMKAAQSNLKILGSPWSAPGWMKLNGVIDGNTDKNNLNDGFTTHDGDGYSSAFADYFVKYIQAFKDKGVSVDAITLQNEPLNSQAGYPTMYMFAEEQATLVQNFVGPALQKAGLDTKVWAYDHNTDQPDYPQTVLDKAGDFVDTVAWHCYANNVDWKVLSDFKSKNDKVQQYMTECWTPRTGSWNQVADFTLGPLQNWAQGVTAWTLGTGPTLSSGGCGEACTGLVTIKDGDYEFETAYYMLAQFSKGLKVGSNVVSATGSYKDDQGKGVEAVGAVNPDGSRAVVMVNTFGNDVYVHLNTSDGVWSGNVPSESVTTWVLPKA